MRERRSLTELTKRKDRTMPKEIRAVVDDVRNKGKKSEFYIAYPEDPTSLGLKKDQSITFSRQAWEEGKEPPMPGQVVILEEVVEFDKGWRARKVRPKVLVIAPEPDNQEKRSTRKW